MAKKFEIRNSTAEFLTFIAEGKEDGIQVLYKDETIWATQKAMAELFDVGVPAISKHLKNIFEDRELKKSGYSHLKRNPPLTYVLSRTVHFLCLALCPIIG